MWYPFEWNHCGVSTVAFLFLFPPGFFFGSALPLLLFYGVIQPNFARSDAYRGTRTNTPRSWRFHRKLIKTRFRLDSTGVWQLSFYIPGCKIGSCVLAQTKWKSNQIIKILISKSDGNRTASNNRKTESRIEYIDPYISTCTGDQRTPVRSRSFGPCPSHELFTHLQSTCTLMHGIAEQIWISLSSEFSRDKWSRTALWWWRARGLGKDFRYISESRSKPGVVILGQDILRKPKSTLRTTTNPPDPDYAKSRGNWTPINQISQKSG